MSDSEGEGTSRPAKVPPRGAKKRKPVPKPGSLEHARRLAGRPAYTTGEIARALGVACRTASKWIDAGRLKGYRLPMCQDRRVPRAELVRFIVAEGLPMPPWLQPPPLMVAGYEGTGLMRLILGREDAPLQPGDAFDAGLLAASTGPRAALCGPLWGGAAQAALIRALARLGIPVLAVQGEDGDPDRLREAGAATVVGSEMAPLELFDALMALGGEVGA